MARGKRKTKLGSETSNTRNKRNKPGEDAEIAVCIKEPDTNIPLEVSLAVSTKVSGEAETSIASNILTAAQKARMELNRQKALLIRQEKLNKQQIYNQKEKEPKKVIRVNDTKLIDTGGGFFIDEKEDGLTEEDLIAATHVISDPPPLAIDEQPFCEDCGKPFDNSYLNHNFDVVICDSCRDTEDKHCLITKTDSRNSYLLTDVDLDKREPPLKYIVRKNPRNSRWGDMKLYLKLQIEKRALEVWGSEEAIEKEIENREEKREVAKTKKYMNKMKELRMNVRSSLYTRAAKDHEHEYGEETYLPDSDEYSKTCSTCGHSYVYEKM